MLWSGGGGRLSFRVNNVLDNYHCLDYGDNKGIGCVYDVILGAIHISPREQLG